MKNRLIAFGAAVVATLSLGGCLSGEVGEVKLGVSASKIQTTEQTVAIDAKEAAGLNVSSVRILVNVVKVGYAGGHDGDSGDSGGEETSAGPIVVELSADEIANGATRSFSLGEMPTGTYGGAEIGIDQLDAGADTTAEGLAEFANENASLLIDGTYGDTDFHFAAHFLAEQGTDGEVTIDSAEPVSLELGIDASSWFVAADGTVLDPTDAAQHDAIALAICKSLDTQASNGGKNGPKAHCVVD